MRADELVRANVGDLRRSDEGAVIHVRGKGGKDRRIPIEPALVDVLEHYLDITGAPGRAAAPFDESVVEAKWPVELFVQIEGSRLGLV